jgi:hypothetical protein
MDEICGVNAQYRIQGNAVYTNEYKKSALSALSKVTIDLGYLNKDAEEVRGLLMRISRTRDADYNQRVESIADDIADTVDHRMRGLIKSQVVSPITAYW